jgi:hypothetical protein
MISLNFNTDTADGWRGAAANCAAFRLPADIQLSG